MKARNTNKTSSNRPLFSIKSTHCARNHVLFPYEMFSTEQIETYTKFYKYRKLKNL